MKFRSGWVLAAATLGLTFHLFSACTPNKNLKSDGGSSRDGGLLITTTELPPATAGKDYAVQMTASGGKGSLTWSIRSAGADITDWLAIDAATGLLHRIGTNDPTQLYPDGTPVLIEVTDTASQKDVESFNLEVNCDVSVAINCYSTSEKVCELGVTHCGIDGQLGQCEGTADAGLSSSFQHCGAKCEACGGNATQCVGGLCKCGLQDACDVDAGMTCCANNPNAVGCSNLQTPDHCGSCDNDCVAAAEGLQNVVAQCDLANFACVNVCDAGFRNCGGVDAGIGGSNGCPINIEIDLANCGDCGKACAMFANTNSSCNAGQCEYACAAGYKSCDPASPDCETHTDGDVNNCGNCGHVCPGIANGHSTCGGGVCGIACNPGLTNCDGVCLNVHGNDPNNCGACDHACPDINPVCSAGQCTH